MRLAVFFLSLTGALCLSAQANATEVGTSTDRLEIARSVIMPSPVPADREVPKAAVIRSEFGLFFPHGSTKKKFVATRKVPLVKDQAYGWRVYLKPGVGAARWREEFVLPAVPKSWNANLPGVTREMSNEGKTSVLEGSTMAGQTVISNLWAVAEGDPAGKYVIRVFVDDKLVNTFEFDVE